MWRAVIGTAIFLVCLALPGCHEPPTAPPAAPQTGSPMLSALRGSAAARLSFAFVFDAFFPDTH